MRRRKKLKTSKHNMLSIVCDDIYNTNKHRHIIALCDCGTRKSFRLSHVRSGSVKSCGCKSSEMARDTKINKDIGKTTAVEKNRMVEMWNDGMSTGEIADIFNITSSSVKSTLNVRGIITTGSDGNIRVRDNLMVSNHNAFDTVTEESDYWGGFIACDGYMRPNNKRVSVSSIDKEHILKLSNFIGSSNMIQTEKRDNNMHSIEFTSEKISSVLIDRYGMHNNKTYTYSVPNISALSHWFWRGVLDADGTITNDGKLSISGTTDKCKAFIDFVKSLDESIHCCLSCSNYRHRDGFSSSVSITRRESSIKILDVLYKNASIYLDRKYKKYLKIKGIK